MFGFLNFNIDKIHENNTGLFIVSNFSSQPYLFILNNRSFCVYIKRKFNFEQMKAGLILFSTKEEMV